MSRILISGSIAYDRIMEFGGRFKEHILPDKLDHLSVSFTVDTFNEGFGGTAGNIAYNLSLLKERPTVIATAGNDFDRYQEWLERCGIDASSIALASDVPTASAYIIGDTGDNQIAAFYIGAMARPYAAHIDMSEDSIAIIAPGNNQDMASLAESYRTLGIQYLYDPGQQSIMLSKEELQAGIEGAGVLFANEYEMGIISERTGWSREDIALRVPVIAITLAEKGTLLIEGLKGTTITAVPVANVVDPTGAGDAYRAGFIKAMRAGLPLGAGIKLGSTVAAYAVEKKGTQNHSFTLEELKKRYEGAYDEVLNFI